MMKMRTMNLFVLANALVQWLIFIFDCLREWLNGKKMTYEGDKVRSFFWRALECELCKAAFEDKMQGRLF